MPGMLMMASACGWSRNRLFDQGAGLGDLRIEGRHLPRELATSEAATFSPATAMCWASAASTAVAATSW